MRCDLCVTALLATGTTAAALRKGFVTTKGSTFKLDGKDFQFAGSNAYYFPFNDVRTISGLWLTILTFKSFLPM
jgi:mannan endo-1,4-beta-mannosidase